MQFKFDQIHPIITHSVPPPLPQTLILQVALLLWRFRFKDEQAYCLCLLSSLSMVACLFSHERWGTFRTCCLTQRFSFSPGTLLYALNVLMERETVNESGRIS